MRARAAIDFYRSYGVHNVSTHAGDSITIVSQPDWDTFAESVASLNTQDVGSLVLTPELITSPDITSRDVWAQQRIIEDRVEDIKGLTRRLPDATLLLGTAAFEHTVEKPRNAVLFLKNGQEVGRTYKAEPTVFEEMELYQEARPEEVRKPVAHVASLICSDFLFLRNHLHNTAGTITVSSRFAAPTGAEESKPIRESDIRAVVEEDIFDWPRLSNVQTIVMADTLPPQSHAQGPYNFVARREQ